jgi:hypothetical protein
MTNFPNIQKKLDTENNPMYLKGFKSEFSFSEWEMKDFILQFLVSLSADYETVDSLTGITLCKRSKRRSIGDIYHICRYYYNNVTFHEVQYWLAILCKEKKIGYFYCQGTKKRVYMSHEFFKTHTYNPIHYPAPDEWNISPGVLTSLSSNNIEEFM